MNVKLRCGADFRMLDLGKTPMQIACIIIIITFVLQSTMYTIIHIQ